MAAFLHVSAALARRTGAQLRGSQRTPTLLTALAAQYDQQRANISTTRVVEKRRGGNSAFVVKTSKFRSNKGVRTKDKLKADVAPHKTHVDRMRELKTVGRENLRNSKLWAQLEEDEELNQELDNVFEYLKNLGPEGEYEYQPDVSLKDLNEDDVLAKLNAIALGDPSVLQEVTERLTEEEGDDGLQSMHELSVDDYNFLMRVYAEKGLHDHATALLARMEKNLETSVAAPFVAKSTESTSTALSLTASLDAVPHRIAPDVKTYMYYILSLVNSGASAPATAVRTLGRMKERGVQPDVHTYNSVMNVCAKAKKMQWAYNIMEKMQLAGLMPDQATFTILMHAAIADGEIDKAFETFHLMRSRVTEPDVVSFTVLIHGYAKLGRIERAINLYEDLLDCGLTPTHVTFNALILACAKSHYFAPKAIEFYREMQELYDYHPDLFTYNNVLHACAKHGDYIQAEEILGHMLKHNVPLDERTYNTLLNVYARAQIRGVVTQAPRNKAPPAPLEEIYQEPLEFDDDGRQIDLTRPFKEVNSLKNWNYDGTFDEEDDEDDEEEQYAEYDDEDEAASVANDGMSEEERSELEKIRAQDQLALQRMDDDFTDDLMLRPMDLSNFGLFQTQVIARAERLYREMTEEKELEPSVVTLTTMLSVYANALRLVRAQEFFAKEFSKHEVEPNVHTYRTLMQMYVRSKRTQKAEELMQEVKHKIAEGELKADAITFGMLVDHYARHKVMRKALVLLEDADALHLPIGERHLKKIRKLTERFGIFTALIPEDPDAVITAGSRSKLMEKRKVRAEVLAYNEKVGKKYLLPASVME
ncbi:hypothetical protein Poli38472_007376 [Pythium oligandrum]|uniref:PROP1-like PPR domain-containing protein n=1 Tax=Pythium oligandrum TaxID=41045 RepID=A0A8K1CA74_PYTOL|nr:hypothetical protein Poli38472_007376 [Pythium oligandrum]|eukprot:TMW59231.1 hypothetical protein Poli38472_007376 [Pythium oligandrum]